MAAPWERYASPVSGPWAKYGKPEGLSADPVNQIPGLEKSVDSTSRVGMYDSSLMDKVKGLGEAAMTTATGAVAAPVGAAAGLVKGLTGGKYGTQQGVREADQRAGQVMQSMTYAPRTEKGKEYAGKVGEFANDVLAGVPIPSANDLGQAAILAKPGMRAAVGNAGRAVADSPEAFALKQAGAKASQSVPSFATKLTPEMQALNAKARQFGIVLQPHQLTDNKFVKVLGETLNYVPGSGSKSEANRIAFETALVNQIGGEGKRLTPKVFDQAMRKSGTTIDAITRKYDLAPSKTFIDKLAEHVNEAQKVETPDVANAVSGWVDQVTSKMSDGPMSGTAFRKLNTALSKKIRSTSNGDLGNALSDLQDTLLEQFNAGVTDAKDSARLQQARMQYAKAKTIAPIVGDPNGVSPAKLLGQVRNTKAGKERYARGRAGELGALGDIGQRLKDAPSSMTSERGLAYGGLGSAAAGLANPAWAGPAAVLYGGANMYNRLSPYLIRPKD